MWRYADFDGDGLTDLVIGIDDWTDYGEPWTGYDAYDRSGKWLRGPLRGQVYVARNLGTNQQPRYATPYRLTVVGGAPLETYGWPSPCVADWDGDGKLDFLLNSSNATWLRQTEHRDGKWYFEDRGPLDPRQLAGHTTCPTAVDFDNNGIPDVVIGAEDGHFYYLRNPRAKQ